MNPKREPRTATEQAREEYCRYHQVRRQGLSAATGGHAQDPIGDARREPRRGLLIGRSIVLWRRRLNIISVWMSRAMRR